MRINVIFLKVSGTFCILQTSKEKRLIDCVILPEGKVNNQQKSKVKDDLMFKVFLGFVRWFPGFFVGREDCFF